MGCLYNLKNMVRSLLLILACAAAGFAQPLPLEGIAHVGYRVRDSETTGAFYTKTLGLARAFRSSDGADFYKVNDEQYIEVAPGLSEREDIRLTHIALQTPDIRAARRLLRARGRRLLLPRSNTGRGHDD